LVLHDQAGNARIADYLPLVQPMPGPQTGTGSAAAAAWWLTNECFGVEVTEAAAAPATTTDRTTTRKASFIIGYPSLENRNKIV
jgi:hypothetical protein